MASLNLLHKLVYLNQQTQLQQLVASLQSDHPLLNHQHRGLSPLGLAIQLNRKECIQILIKKSKTILKNNLNWSTYNEATSIGDRIVMELVYMKRRAELKDLRDFSLEMHWQFQSWIPFISRLCPSDTYKIYKKGTSVRIDTTLVGFEQLTWIRGDISIVFKEDPIIGPMLVICDHQRKVVQQIYPKDYFLTQKDLEEEITVSLNTKIIAPPEVDFSNCVISRLQTGYFFKADRVEIVGKFNTMVYQMDNLRIGWKTRSEHLDPTHFTAIDEKDNEPHHFHIVNPDSGLVTEKKHIKKSLIIDDVDDKIDNQKDSLFINDVTDKLDSQLLKNVNLNEDLINVEYKSEDETNVEDSSVNNGGYLPDEDKPVSRKVMEEVTKFKPSLKPPPKTTVSFEEYFDDNNNGEYIHMGRKLVLEESTRDVKATIWMYNGNGGEEKSLGVSSSWFGGGTTDEPEKERRIIEEFPAIQSKEFPLSIEQILPLLELLGMGSNQHIRSLKEFFTCKLPAGFPIQIEIPLGMLPLSGLITFGNVISVPLGEKESDEFIPDDLFLIPGKKEGYRAGEIIGDAMME